MENKKNDIKKLSFEEMRQEIITDLKKEIVIERNKNIEKKKKKEDIEPKAKIRLLHIFEDNNFMKSVKLVYELIKLEYDKKKLRKDVENDIFSKNRLSYRDTIWYLNNGKNIGVDYYTQEILWNRGV